MKIIKYVFFVIVLLIVIGGTSFYLYLQSIKPVYSGQVALEGLNKNVEVLYDEFGIPHIYGNNEEDLYYALGYVKAQDRLWQMELIRRIAAGRLAEIFGEELVETDAFFRTLGIDAYSQKNVESMRSLQNAPFVKMAEAYLKGVNTFIDEGFTPIEYTILGLEKTHFSLLDIENVFGYMAFSFAIAHKTDPLVTKIWEEFGPEYLQDLDLDISPKTTLIHNFKGEILSQFGEQTSRVMANLPVAQWIGSNSWIVGPEKSSSGHVILANDPHIGFSQPSVWYEAHLSMPGWEMYGHYLAGYPFASLTFNRHFATGLTMFENDDIDFYRTDINPEQDKYLYNGEWIEFGSREERIKVKNSDDVIMHVRTTTHGPVVTDILEDVDDKSIISMWWMYTSEPSEVLSLLYEIGKSTNISEVKTQIARLHAPGLNVMYGDAMGNIAWWAAGKLPIRPDHVNSKMILDGTSDKDEPLGYMDFSQNPQAINPPWNYLYSANNQPDTINGSLYPGYYLPESRAKRIVELLESEDKVDVNYYKRMLLDNRSPEADVIAKELLSAIEPDTDNKELIGLFKGWNGSHNADDSAPVLYHKLLFHILSLCFEDELEESFDRFLDTHLFHRSVKGMMLNDSSIWWDNINTSQIETREEIFQQAYLKSVNELEDQLGKNYNKWKWSEVHLLEHPHALGQSDLLRPYFNVGPFKIGASTNVLNNLKFKPSGEGIYHVFAGPSTRRIIDFGDIENSFSILPTGQSGNIMSDHYDDQAQMYNSGQFRKQLINRDEINNSAINVLQFVKK